MDRINANIQRFLLHASLVPKRLKTNANYIGELKIGTHICIYQRPTQWCSGISICICICLIPEIYTCTPLNF